MKNNSPLDDHIKKQFSNYTPEVPAHIWGNIVAGNNKRKPGGFWFSFNNRNGLFILLGLLLIGTAFLIYKKPDHNQQSIPGANNKIKAEAGTSDQSMPGAERSTGTISQPNETKNSLDDKNITLASTVASQKKDFNGPNNIQPAVSHVKATNNDIQNHNGFFRHPKHVKGKTSMFVNDPSAGIDNENPEEKQGAGVSSATNDLLLHRLLLNLSSQHTEQAQPGIKKINIPALNIPCPRTEKNAAGNKRYIEIYGGPDYAFRSLKDTANSIYLEKRKESSRFSSAFSAGMRYTKVFNNGMSFRTGINYSQINEKFKYSQGNIIQVIYITNNNGDTTGSFTTSGTRYKTTYNKFRTIDLPIVFGYELGNGKLHLNFNAGAMINIYSWQKGDVLDTAYQPVSITTGKGSSPYQFKTNAGIGFIGGVSVYYKLSNRLHFLAEPYFRYNFSPANKSDLTLKQKYNTAGLRLGLRFDF